jgi:type I restriction enzyme S subunit
MIADLKPYAKYKKSGLPWLGSVPAHWEVRQARHIGRFLKGVGGTKEDAVPAGVPCVRYGELYTTYTYFIRASKAFIRAERAAGYMPIQYGDVLFAASGETIEEIGKSAVNLMQTAAVCGGDVIVLRPSIPVHAPFLGYAMDCRPATNQKATMGRGTTVKHIYPDELRSLLFPLPTLDEQAEIVRLLDWANGRLERAIRAKRKVIALLNEQKQVIIHRAVTRGLDPSVPLKASGISWLGDIPQHWEATKLYRVTDPARKIMYGIVLPGPDVDTGVYIIKGGNCEDGRLRAECLSRTTTEIESGYARSRLRGSDIVYAIRGSIGAAQIVPDELAGANLTQDAARIAPGPGIFPLWLLFAVRSQSFFSKLEAGALGATIRGINIRDLKRADLAVPPMEEQEQIAMFLLERTGRVNTAISRLEREIELLREYRSRLVADVVTGKVDVREAAVQLPQEAAVDTPEDDTDLDDETEGAKEEAAA